MDWADLEDGSCKSLNFTRSFTEDWEYLDYLIFLKNPSEIKITK